VRHPPIAFSRVSLDPVDHHARVLGNNLIESSDGASPSRQVLQRYYPAVGIVILLSLLLLIYFLAVFLCCFFSFTGVPSSLGTIINFFEFDVLSSSFLFFLLCCPFLLIL
jgi:hypothetical protein